MPKVKAKHEIRQPHFFSQVATWPALVTSKIVVAAEKVIAFVKRAIWPAVPYRPTQDEKEIAAKAEFLKQRLIKPAPAALKYHQINPLQVGTTVRTTPAVAKNLGVFVNRFVKKELHKMQEAANAPHQKEALAALSPLLTGLGGLFAKKQAALLQNVVFPPPIAPLSPPLKSLGEVGKQMLMQLYENAKKEIVEPRAKEALNLADPLIGPFFDTMIQKLGEVVEQVAFTPLFDELVKTLSEETKAVVKANRACSLERKKLEDQQKLQREKPADPQVKIYIEKLTRGALALAQFPPERQGNLIKAEVEKLKGLHPSHSPVAIEEWARTNVQMELYLQEFYAEKFVKDPYCDPQVKEIFDHRKTYQLDGLIKNDLTKMADALVSRLFPLLENEFHRAILPILGLHFTDDEKQVVIQSAKAALPKLWDLYKGGIVTGLTDLLQMPVTDHLWKELLADEILPFAQDKLLKQQFRLTVDAKFEEFRPLLHIYSFEKHSDAKKEGARRLQVKEAIGKKLHAADDKRAAAVVAELLTTLEEECYLVRKKLGPVLEERCDFLSKQLKKMGSPVALEEKVATASAKILNDWEQLVIGRTHSPVEKVFCQYAQPLMEQMTLQLKQKKNEMTDFRLLQNVLDDIPDENNKIWGDFVWDFVFKFDEFAPNTQKLFTKFDWAEPFKGTVSDAISFAVEPFRSSMMNSIDQLVGLCLSKLGQPNGKELDPKKIQAFLFQPRKEDPDLEKRLAQEIEKTSKLTHSLLVDHVAPKVVQKELSKTWWGKVIPGKDFLAKQAFQMGLLGKDSSHIQAWIKDVMKGMFQNPFINLNRIHRIFDRVNPRLDEAIAQVQEGAKKKS